MKRPRVNTLLVVTLDDADEELHSRVEDVLEDGTLVIAQPSRVGKPQVGIADDREIQLSWQIRSGIAHQDHVVLRRAYRGLSSLIVEPIGEPVVIQRRDYARVNVMLTVYVETHLGQEGRGTTTDLSGGGMQAIMPIKLADGQTIDVRIVLPGDEVDIECRAHTIRELTEDTYAFGFSEIEDADRERLIRFVFAKQQSMLREGRLSA
jgi:c-di-GMP-binding flagellar brake protein YcgR